jgi:type VI protein secretion system component Hcp
MQKLTMYLTLVLGIALSSARPANVVQDKIYIRFESPKQGAFHPSKSAPKGNDFFECKNMAFLSAPVNSGSAKSNGATKHEPLKVTIESAVAAPQLLQANWSNLEMKVQVELTHVTATGKEQTYMTITLTSAIITSLALQGDQEVVTLNYKSLEYSETP